MGLCCGWCRSCCSADSDSCCGGRRRRMGYSGAAVLASATAPAVVDEKGALRQPLPYHQCLPWRLSERKTIHLVGRVPEKPYRWTVNLMVGGMDNDYALHLNTRHDAGYVVRNTKKAGDWDQEEICGSPPMPFAPGEDFDILIFATKDAFLIAVNGRHFATYQAHLPVASVSTILVDGTVQLQGVFYAEDVDRYPPQMAPTLRAESGAGYRSQNPVLPCRLPEPICDGGQITVIGRVKLLPFSFTVNLLDGDQLYPAPNIVLHFNPRFQVGEVEGLVLNTRTTSAGWGLEERPAIFPFRPGRSFALRFVCEQEAWLVYVDGALLTRYKHRLPASHVLAIAAQGDIIIASIEYEPNAADLIQL